MNRKLIKDILMNIALGFIALAGALAFAEMAMRVITSHFIIYDIEMHKYAKKLKRRSSVPGLSHEHIPNAKAHLMGVDVELNRLGFRDRDFPSIKPNHEFRILLVGSSITLGWGVKQDSVFTNVLEKKLNDLSASQKRGISYRVINSGIGNYNTKLESIALKQNLSQVNPDMIILHYFLRDAEEISFKSSNFIVSHSYFAAYLVVRVKQLLSQFKSGNVGDYYRNLYTDQSPSWKTAQDSILEIRNLCQSKNIKFMVVIQPELHNFSEESPQNECYKIVENFLSKNNIPSINLIEIFRKTFKVPSDVWVNPDDAHPNAEGHRLMADDLFEYLKNKI